MCGNSFLFCLFLLFSFFKEQLFSSSLHSSQIFYTSLLSSTLSLRRCYTQIRRTRDITQHFCDFSNAHQYRDHRIIVVDSVFVVVVVVVVVLLFSFCSKSVHARRRTEGKKSSDLIRGEAKMMPRQQKKPMKIAVALFLVRSRLSRRHRRRHHHQHHRHHLRRSRRES